jgi:translin
MENKDLELIRNDLSRYDEVREQILNFSREAVRLSSSSILEVHRGDLKQADSTLRRVEKTLGSMRGLYGEYSEFRTAPSVVLAFQEFVEAVTLRNFSEKGTIPSLKEAGGEPRSYMLGLLDAIGEFRRMTLNCLRKGDVGRAETVLGAMEGVYEDLQSLDHTSIIPTFRVKMDAARRIIESTRGDVVTEMRRYSLEKALEKLGSRLESDRKAARKR